MLNLTIRSGLRSLRSVTPEQKEDILNAAAGRVRSLLEEHFDGLPSRRFWKEAAVQLMRAHWVGCPQSVTIYPPALILLLYYSLRIKE